MIPTTQQTWRNRMTTPFKGRKGSSWKGIYLGTPWHKRIFVYKKSTEIGCTLWWEPPWGYSRQRDLVVPMTGYLLDASAKLWSPRGKTGEEACVDVGRGVAEHLRVELELWAHNHISYGDLAAGASHVWHAGHLLSDLKVTWCVGGRSSPDAGLVDDLHVQEVPIHLLGGATIAVLP